MEYEKRFTSMTGISYGITPKAFFLYDNPQDGKYSIEDNTADCNIFRGGGEIWFGLVVGSFWKAANGIKKTASLNGQIELESSLEGDSCFLEINVNERVSFFITGLQDRTIEWEITLLKIADIKYII